MTSKRYLKLKTRPTLYLRAICCTTSFELLSNSASSLLLSARGFCNIVDTFNRSGSLKNHNYTGFKVISLYFTDITAYMTYIHVLAENFNINTQKRDF